LLYNIRTISTQCHDGEAASAFTSVDDRDVMSVGGGAVSVDDGCAVYGMERCTGVTVVEWCDDSYWNRISRRGLY
jgi:hypothetical protein